MSSLPQLIKCTDEIYVGSTKAGLSVMLIQSLTACLIVKHEIFLADVTTCFNSLKKAITEINMASSAQLQMGQPSARLNDFLLSILI